MSDPITEPTHERPTTQSEGKYKKTLPSVYIKPLEEAQDFFTQVDQAKLNKSSFARMPTGFSDKVEVGLNKVSSASSLSSFSSSPLFLFHTFNPPPHPTPPHPTPFTPFHQCTANHPGAEPWLHFHGNECLF